VAEVVGRTPDGADEIYLAKSGGVDTYTAAGQRVGHIGLPVQPDDLMDVGDTDGDAKAEVLLAGDAPGRFYIYEADFDYQVVLSYSSGTPS